MGVANDEDVLGDTITPGGTSFQSIREAIAAANNGDIIDLGGLTYTGAYHDYNTNKNITIQNGIFDGSLVTQGHMSLTGVTLKNLHFTNFNYNTGYNFTRPFTFENCTLENIKFTNSINTAQLGMFSLFMSCKCVNLSYDNITSATSVAGIRYSNFYNVNFTNSRVTASTRDMDTGQFTVMTESTLVNCNFINTSSNQHSGAICMGRGENTVLYSNFINCTAWIGGAIYAHGDFEENKKHTIENCKFINCSAEAEGGALGLSHNNMDVKNCVFINNTATKGAGIMVGGINYPKAIDGDNTHGHNITVDNCYFEKNIASEEGGAVHISGDNNTIFKSEFYYNEAPEGGAVHIAGDNASAIDSIFDDNFAHDGEGAAIYVRGDYASIDNTVFTNHDSDMGTVYIEGNYFNCTGSEFRQNTATHGGTGIYVEGNHTYISHSIFRNNNASMHGGAVHTIGDHAKILYSNFTYNNALPSSDDSEYGLGGAVYIDGDYNEISYSLFKHNTARNGSAIYNRGVEFVLNDDLFENNQAWSYFLFTEAKPPESYWSEDLEVLVNVTLVAGNNLINAIYNDWHSPTPQGVVDEITFHNVTFTVYPNDHYPTGIRTTTAEEIHPVLGVENSHDGKYLYQDAREDNQVVNINVTFKDGLIYEYSGKTNMYGNVLLSLKKENMSDRQFHPGLYTVNANHPDDYIYTAISNSTTFTVNPHVDVSVTKTSDKDVYIVGENAVFTIKVNGVGTNATNVRVKDLLPESFKFVSYSATKGTYDSEANEWYIGFLPHLGSETLILTIQTTELGTFDNVVNVTSTEKDWNLSNNVDNKTIEVNLYYTKEANATNVSAGDNLEYYLRVYNVGNSDYTEEIQIRDTLPQGIKYLGEYELQGADLVRYINYGDHQIWYVTNISAGTRAKITVKAQAIEDGIWNNTMNVWNFPEVNATVNVTHNADLEITKTASSPRVHQGDIINWTIVVINHGPSTASDVVVKDILPAGLEIYGTPVYTSGTRFSPNTGIWTINTLEVGKSVQLIIPTRVTVLANNITNVANVTSSTPDPDLTNNEDNDTIDFYPDVGIDKVVSAETTSHGAVISWTINVTNYGPHDATGVYVIDQLPAGLRYVNSTATNGARYNPVSGRWNIGILKENESVILVIYTEVTAYDGFISNNATVYADEDSYSFNNYDDDFTEVITKADVGVVKLVSNQTSHYGDEITWTIVVTNYGPSVAENVVLIDYLPYGDLVQLREPYKSKGQVSHEGVTGRWDIGDMAVGESQYMIVYTKVNATDKTIINVVNVTSDTEDPNPSNNRAENSTYVPPESDVQVIKRVSNSTPSKYDEITWTITVYNAGPNVAENVIATDVLPAGLEFVSNIPAPIGMYHKDLNQWDIRTLEVGVRYTLNITTKVVDTGKITNEVNVTTSTYDINLENNYDNETIDVPAIADLEITKIVSNKTPKYGDLINWTIIVHNKGPNNARNVVVNDKLPAGLIYITHETSTGLYDSAQGIWQIGDVLIDQTVSLTVTTRINITNATIRNIAVVTSTTPDNDTSNNEANNTTYVGPVADLAIVKTVDNHGPKKGDNITWTITVTNNGPDAAINAIAKDPLPKGLVWVEDDSNGAYDPATGIWTIGTLEANTNVTLLITTTVNVTKQVLTNIVNVTSETPDPDLTNNEDDETIDVGHETDLEVIKTVSNSTPKKGDKIVWNITVINHGSDDAVETVVSDQLPEGLVWVEDDSKGAYDPATGIWTIGTLEANTNVTLLITTLVNVSGKNITNVAVVTTDTHDTNESNNEDNDTVDVENIVDLRVTKYVNPDVVVSGETVYWTIYVVNLGPDVAVDAYAIDKLPKELIFVSASTQYGKYNSTTGKYVYTYGTGEEYNSTTGLWTIGNMSTLDFGRLTLETIANSTIETTIPNTVFTNSSTPDSDYTNNYDWDSVDVIVVADLEVIKEVSNKNPKYGEEITWTITVTNNGPSDAKDVTVTDNLPAGLIFNGADGDYNETTGVWTIGDLANGESRVLVISTIVNITNRTITNVAVVNSTTPDNNTDNNKGNNTTDVDPEADLEIIKLVSDKTAKKGDEITWTIIVTNNGPDSALEVYVKDELPAGLVLNKYSVTKGLFDQNTLTWYMKSLANGESQTLTLTTLVNVTNKTLVNTVNVTNDVYDPNETNNEANNTTDVDPRADLVVVKEVSKQSVITGEIITWTVTVTNKGPDTAVNTRVSDILPAGLIFIKSDGNYNNNTGIWIVGDLANGASAKLVITTQVNITNETIRNVANATSDTPGNSTPGNNTTDVDPIADLAIVKVVSDDNPHFGDEITWTITVTNNGPSDAKNVRVTDKLPAGLIYNGANGTYNPNTGLWIVGDLANGESASLVINTIVDITNKTIVNVANVTSDTPDSNKTNNEDNDTADVPPEADLEVIKETQYYNHVKGDIVEWKITIINHGPDAAVDVIFGDLVQSGLVFIDENGNYIDREMIIVETGITLESGKSISFVIKTLVNTTNTELNNRIAVNSDTYDPNMDNNVDDETIKVQPEANLVVVKEVSKQSVKTGETVTWTITVTNNGPDESVNTRVTDKLPEGLIYTGHKGEGNYDPETGVWIVGDLANGESKQLVIETIVDINNETIVNVANVTSDTPGNRTPGENNTTVVGDIADLEVIKLLSNSTPKKGDEITWTIIVINHGPDKAVGVNVTDNLPAELVYNGHDGPGVYDSSKGIWIIGDMAKGETATLVIRTIVNVSNGTITNVAVANSSTPDNNTDNNKGNNTTTVNDDADLVIVKVVSNKNPKFGEEITWTITVTNNGPSDAKDVRVTDKLPAGLIFNGANGNYNKDTGLWIVGDLANGKSASLVIKTIVNITNATITNVANVTSDTPDSNKTNNEANNTTDVDPKADLVVVKEVSNKNPHKGDIITWTITVTNNGPDNAVNVRVTDRLPAGLIFKGADGNYNKDTGLWIVGDLASGASAKLVITTQVDVTNATIPNIANATSDTPGNSTPGNNSTDVPPEADLEIIKLVSSKTTQKGEVITWTIKVTNNGPDAAENIYVKDALQNGLSYKAHTTSKGLFDSNTLTWFIDALNNGESATLTIDTLVNVDDTTLVNNVNVTNDVYDPNESNNKANNTTTVDKELPADLEVVKVVSDANPHKGDIITWTVTVTNNGPGSAKDVTVTDKLPAGLKFISATGNYDKDTGVWTVGNLANGAKATLIITTQVDITNDSITNIAVVTSTTDDPNPNNNKDNDTAEVDPEADVKVVKTVSNSKPYKGDTITWTVVVTNLGPDKALNVIVEENLPEGLQLVSAKGSKGSFDDGIWTVGDLNNGEIATLTLTTKVTATGAIENIVVASSSTYDPNKTNNRDKETATPKDKPASADLEVIKVANKDKVKVGDKIVWTITVINHGPDKAVGVYVQDILDAGDAVLISGTPDVGEFDVDTGIWDIGDMEAGDTATLTVVFRALSEGEVVNYAEVISETPDPNPDNNQDSSTVEVVDDNNAPVPDGHNVPAPSTPTMHATGNPIVMVLLALFAIAGVSLRRKD